MELSLKNRAAIITGASQGLGLAISKKFAQAGAEILMCARDPLVLGRAYEEVTISAAAEQAVSYIAADISNPADAHLLVETAMEQFSRLDILVNNAGVYGPKGPVEENDWEYWVQAIQINLMGSVLMCREVLPHLKANRSGKIIQLSGGGATSPIPYLSAYAASKAAIIRFVESLAGEVRDFGIDVNAIAPGALNTRMLDEILAAGPEKVGRKFFERSLCQKNQGGTPLEKGADLAVFLASSASNGITGKLISAIWDPWDNLRDHLPDIQNTDIYTLRRIVPKDRGLDWGEP
jgi:NAD(P)-dependent dehydrogenase (short-subunit alcohol dehydrogenase family)